MPSRLKWGPCPLPQPLWLGCNLAYHPSPYCSHGRSLCRGGKVWFWTSIWIWTNWTEPIDSGSVQVQFSPYPVDSDSGLGTHPECRTSSELVQTLNLGSNRWGQDAQDACYLFLLSILSVLVYQSIYIAKHCIYCEASYIHLGTPCIHHGTLHTPCIHLGTPCIA